MQVSLRVGVVNKEIGDILVGFAQRADTNTILTCLTECWILLCKFTHRRASNLIYIEVTFCALNANVKNIRVAV